MYQVPWDTGLKTPPREYLRLARETARRKLGLRAVAELEGRIELAGERVLVYAMGVVETGPAFRPDEERGELVGYANFLSAANGEAIAIFDAAGGVWVQDGREHCLAVLLPSVLVASIIFGNACYEVTWKRRTGSAYLDPDTGAFIRRWPGDERRTDVVSYVIAQGIVYAQ